MKNMYLPCWTDGLSFREQYDAYWIANEYEKAIKNADGSAFYSLLPLRFDNMGYYNQPEEYNYLDFESKWDRVYPFDLHQNFKIYKCLYQFALAVWKKAAEMIKEEYPDIENITFGCSKKTAFTRSTLHIVSMRLETDRSK